MVELPQADPDQPYMQPTKTATPVKDEDLGADEDWAEEEEEDDVMDEAAPVPAEISYAQQWRGTHIRFDDEDGDDATEQDDDGTVVVGRKPQSAYNVSSRASKSKAVVVEEMDALSAAVAGVSVQ